MDSKQPQDINPQAGSDLAEPFSRIFVDRAEADWAFDLLREATRRLRVIDPYDRRVAVTVSARSGKPFLHLSFGSWLVLGFQGPGLSAIRVDMALLTDQVARDERFTVFSSDRKAGEPEVRSYALPIEAVRPLTSPLQQAFETTLDFIADKFASWKRSPHWKQHNPEIIEALFDPEKRDQLLAGGLAEAELRYERHRTAFHLEVAEEEGIYQADGTSSTSVEDTPSAQLLHRKGPEPESGGEAFVEVSSVGDDPEAVEIKPVYPLSTLARDTGFSEELLRRWVRAIDRKQQAILYGPPGTGKTFMAEGLARHLVGGRDGFWEVVQFHPAYAYEDFVQGLRPTVRAEGGLDYRMVPGHFLQFCQASQPREGRCVLIIDEINRTNLARVFGELMYLLEYRNREMPLAGGGTLKIPANVRLIGTMNTADRSIALVDHALRRRFAFIAMRPNVEILRQYHRRHDTNFPIEGLIKLVTRLNGQIEEDYRVGITFFLRQNLADEIEDIWRMEIEPYLEEYFFDQRSKADDYRWDEIKGEILSG